MPLPVLDIDSTEETRDKPREDTWVMVTVTWCLQAKDLKKMVVLAVRGSRNEFYVAEQKLTFGGDLANCHVRFLAFINKFR